MKKSTLFFIVLLMASMLFPEQAEGQCSMCRAVLESEEGQETAKGINDGIVYLMAMPYILIAGVGYVIYRMVYK